MAGGGPLGGQTPAPKLVRVFARGCLLATRTPRIRSIEPAWAASTIAARPRFDALLAARMEAGHHPEDSRRVEYLANQFAAQASAVDAAMAY